MGRKPLDKHEIPGIGVARLRSISEKSYEKFESLHYEIFKRDLEAGDISPRAKLGLITIEKDGKEIPVGVLQYTRHLLKRVTITCETPAFDYLDMIGILPEYRGKGIAKAILSGLKGDLNLLLDVNANGPIKLYENIGFKKVYEETDHTVFSNFPISRREADPVVYGLAITSTGYRI